MIWAQGTRLLPPFAVDVIRLWFPFEWRDALWYPGAGWLVSAMVLAGMGVGAVGLGYLRFGRRDV